jgi:tRNA modification GTPase
MVGGGFSDGTIAAPVTPVGGAVCVVRISGGGALDVLRRVFVGGGDVYESHRVYYGKIADENEIVDEVLVTVMLAPRSYTAEDVVEIGCHGGAATVGKVMGCLLTKGARLAEPGEFTKRAFLNGRLDLSQAEAVADLVAAQTEAARRSALGRLNGGLRDRVRGMAGNLLEMVARIEAAIDYPEHGDEIGADGGFAKRLDGLIGDVRKLLGTYEAGRTAQDGIRVVILGKPNVGKSSLLNALVGGDRAIVTDVPGTTRDVLRERLDIRGIPVTLSDTAGLRETADPVEKIGVERAADEAAAADLVIRVVDGAEGADIPTGGKCLVAINKTDIKTRTEIDAIRQTLGEADVMEVSALDGTGVDELRDRIRDMFVGGETDFASGIITTMRHKEALEAVLGHLEEAAQAASGGLADDFVSIDLMAAYRRFGDITGENVAEDIIDKIFSGFCLGK